MNPSVMTVEFKDYVYLDIQNTFNTINKEKEKRLANLNDYTHLRSWDPVRREFRDIESAFRAVKEIEQYVFNRQASVDEYTALNVFIRKTDKIWKHNFNDYMKKYKFESDKIVRNNNV
jgi:hypothetical protein